MPEARQSLVLVVCSAVAATGAAVVFFFDPAQYSFYPICYLNFFTGLNCPGCGSLRAIHQLLHGHIGAAARLNLLLVSCLPFAGWGTLRAVATWLYGHPFTLAIRPIWLWTFLAVATVFTVLRNLPGFEWLAP